ncbi:diiron oxygenase [Nocardia farcinica]|uniref:diiron oxygenase n=1 Tax=Nocardia farcinica TaxID=37329 RepID=UPI0021598BEB|nr:diiron oxygenase [Nocardia farcinica]
MLAATADRPDACARLTWAVVGELSIYEFLTIVSDDETIQPGSRQLLELHERDEAAHASIVAQVMRGHFHEFGKEQNRRIESLCHDLDIDLAALSR